MNLRCSSFSLLFCLVGCFATAEEFPKLYNSEPGNPAPTTPEAALAALKVPPGFKAQTWAHEPMVQNPIAMAWDRKGRMWVAENFTYAEKPLKQDFALRDRVLILEDKDHDGVAETRTVFTDGPQMLTSVEVGRGGVWLMCPPQLLFIPDVNGDDVPDGPAQVVLDGFTVPKDNYHNFANGLRWGPDGWLYGRCGASAPGEVGVPGQEERIPLRGTMWRYHPQRKVFEALTHGTTNPWGHDWDEHGELFFVNTVNGHLWHMFPGAHYVRPHTLDPNPHTYAMIDMHADHWHFDTGKGWTASRDGSASDLGGGHAHEGAMIYQGSLWPKEYQGRLFTLNFHGRRANVERLERQGSGYVAKHDPDAFQWGDPWFRGIDIQQGPDGAAYVLDWSDTGECHESTGVHRESGRIYRLSYGEGQVAKPSSLLEQLLSPEVWQARMALRTISDLPEAAGLRKPMGPMLMAEKETPKRLRLLWALHAAGGTHEEQLRGLLHDGDEHVRAWAIRLLTDAWPLDTVLSARPKQAGPEPSAAVLADLQGLAKTDPSALVRLVLGSTLQRLPWAQRAALAAPLLAHAEDAQDHNLPLLLWYGIMPLGEADPAALGQLAGGCELPITRRYIARRLAEEIEKNPGPVNTLLQLSAAKPAAFQQDVLTGMAEAFTGWRKARQPEAWAAFAKAATVDAEGQARLRDLSVLFGDGRALDEVKRVALDAKAEMPMRQAALRTLMESRPPELRSICEGLLGTRYLNATAAQGLALFDDPKLGERLAKELKNFAPADRPGVVAVLVSRPAWAAALLQLVGKGTVPRGELTAFHARQIRGFQDAQLTAKLTEVWGELRDSAADKVALIAGLRPQLTPALLAKADASKGRALFNMTCAACHTLYGAGGKIGPDLTGSGRENLDYLLENIADPSAVVTADFRMTTLTLKDGRVLTGMIAGRTERTLQLRTLTETQSIERAEVAKQEESAQSLMPEGLLLALQPEQVRDLFAYLMGKQQVP